MFSFWFSLLCYLDALRRKNQNRLENLISFWFFHGANTSHFIWFYNIFWYQVVFWCCQEFLSWCIYIANRIQSPALDGLKKTVLNLNNAQGLDCHFIKRRLKHYQKANLPKSRKIIRISISLEAIESFSQSKLQKLNILWLSKTEISYLWRFPNNSIMVSTFNSIKKRKKKLTTKIRLLKFTEGKWRRIICNLFPSFDNDGKEKLIQFKIIFHSIDFLLFQNTCIEINGKRNY